MNRRLPVAAAIPAALCLLPRVGTAQASKHDPKALSLLEQCAAATRALSAVHTRISVKAAPSDLFQPAPPDSIEYWYQKPGRLRVELTRTEAGRTSRLLVMTDGASVWRWQSGKGPATKAAAPRSIAEIADLPLLTPDLALLANPALDVKTWPSANFSFRPAEPEKRGADEFDVIAGFMGENGGEGGANLKIYLGRKDHLVRGMVIEVQTKLPAANEKRTGRLDLTYDLVDTSPPLTLANFRPAAKPASRAHKLSPSEHKPARKP